MIVYCRCMCIIIVLLFVGMSCLFLACNSSHTPQGTVQMRFAVDTNYLEPVVIIFSTSSIQFSVQAPKRFMLVDSTITKSVAERIRSTNPHDTVSILPLVMSASATTGSMMVISAVTFPLTSDDADTLMYRHHRLIDYKRILYTKYDSTTIRTASFMKNDCMVEQFLITDSATVNFRLLYLAGRKEFIQQDFIIPKKSYDEYTAKSLESSIGSFILLTHYLKR